MALVVIQIQDTPDGAVVRLSNEPPLVAPRARVTRAEELGAAALSAIEAEINAASRIQIVGADALPN